MIQSTVVNNQLAKRLGFDEEQLYRLAEKNTRHLFPPVVRCMSDIILEMCMKDNVPSEVAEAMIGDIPPKQMMWVLSNSNGINGAVAMMYDDKLQQVSKALGSDLYVLPSSVHEVIAVSTEMGNPEELAAMVAEINMGQVELAERLSNQVYHYDKDLRELSLATDTPNKRLDEVVAEQEKSYEVKKPSR